jgi:hypothetical protein
MSDTTSTESSSLDGLRQIRDEIRLKIHLAALETRQKWQELEQQLESLEHRVTPDSHVMDATGQLAHDLKQSLVDFRRRLSE